LFSASTIGPPEHGSGGASFGDQPLADNVRALDAAVDEYLAHHNGQQTVCVSGDADAIIDNVK
jgi:hypothetical protein